MGSRILVVEDDHATSRLVTMALNAAGYQPTAVYSFKTAREIINSERFELVLCDLYLGDGTGLELLVDQESQEAASSPPFVMFTAQGSVETAVEAIRKGAFDYLAKPFRIDDLMRLVTRALAASSPIEETVESEVPRPTQLIGNSPPMVELYKKIALAAQSDAPVLVTGETGTGKELVARCLHEFSDRRSKPFIPVNCGALTETLLESELFGHERGAFTGAVAARKGLFEQAAGGTLFLDEISETAFAFQVKLLRALQEGEIRPVGGSRVVNVDVRIIAASNQDLAQAMKEGQFRKDLFYRLSVVQLVVPALRDRRDDIVLLARHFLEKVSKRQERRINITEGALQVMKQYSWPGNVRELENAIERVAVLKTDPVIFPEDLEFHVPADSVVQGKQLSQLDMVEREKIIEVLRDTGGNRAEASRRLGIERKSLYRKAKRLGIDLDQFAR